MNDPDVLTVTVTATGLAAAGEIDTSTVSVLTVALESHMLDSSEGDVVLNMAAVEFTNNRVAGADRCAPHHGPSRAATGHLRAVDRRSTVA